MSNYQNRTVMEDLKNIVLGLNLRSDKESTDSLQKTFVQVGPVMVLLQSTNNHVLYGRRGTGKTHVFKVLQNIKEAEGDCVIYVDMRLVGSSSSLYHDKTIPLDQRAIRLAIDMLQVIKEGLTKYITEKYNREKVSLLIPKIGDFEESYSQTKYKGEAQKKETLEASKNDENQTSISISSVPAISFGNNNTTTDKKTIETFVSGTCERFIDINKSAQILDEITRLLSPKKIWILIDEYAEIPSDLQIVLSDIIRRLLCPLQNVIVKIAAIEHRSIFRENNGHSFIGLELGADVSTINLDNQLVFGYNQATSLMFFRELLFNHLNYKLGDDDKRGNSNEVISELFTNEGAFLELVLAAEGIPRDFMNILSKAVQIDYYGKISVPTIRKAAKLWYQEDKYNNVSNYPNANDLLRWIIDEVIGKRHARAFLLQADKKYKLIDYLYDSRILRLIKQGISGRDKQANKYNVYSIDYGCYCDLINTANQPDHLLEDENEDGTVEKMDIPKDDYRSIRRSILDMDEFYKQKELSKEQPEDKPE